MSKKKNKINKTLVEKILDKKKISYESLSFNTKENGDNRDLDIDDSINKHNIFKTLVLTGTTTGPLVGILPIDMHLSYKKLAKISNNKKIGMVPLKNLINVSGFEHGANSPVGIRSLHDYPIYFDNTAKEQKIIIISAGKVGRSIRINAEDLAKSVDGQFGDFAVYEEEK